jgi:hypothetical protein
MILNGKTPRALTLAGLLGVAGVGLLLLPMAPGWAQSNQQNREDGERKEQRGKKEGREKGPGDGPQGGDLQNLRAQIQQVKAAMAMHAAHMDRLMEQLRRMEQAKQGGGPNPFGPIGGENRKKKGGEREGNNQGGRDGPGDDDNKKKGGRDGNHPGVPGLPGAGGPGGRPGFGGGGGGGGGFGGFGPGAMPGGPRSPIDQRLNDVERKLDQLLQEIRSMRNDMKGRPGGAGGNTPMRNPMPNPRGRASEQPPAPPATPAPRRERDQNEN